MTPSACCLSLIVSPNTSPSLHDRLQLSSVAQRVLDDGTACAQDISLVGQQVLLLLREVYPPIFDDPSPVLREIDYGAFRVEEEEVLRVGDRNGCVGLLRARGDFVADGADEELFPN